MKKLTIFNIILFLFSIISLIYSQTRPPEVRVEKEIVQVPQIQEVEKIKEVKVVVYKTKIVNKCEEKPEPAFVSLSEKSESKKEEKISSYFEEKKNRISAFIAHGPKSIGYSISGSNYDVEMKNDVLLGAMYARKVSKDWSIFAGAITNNTYMLGAGVDY